MTHNESDAKLQFYSNFILMIHWFNPCSNLCNDLVIKRQFHRIAFRLVTRVRNNPFASLVGNTLIYIL